MDNSKGLRGNAGTHESFCPGLSPRVRGNQARISVSPRAGVMPRVYPRGCGGTLFAR